MKDAEPITDLAACGIPLEQLYKSAHSLKGYKSWSIFTWLTERKDPQGLVTEAPFQVSLGSISLFSHTVRKPAMANSLLPEVLPPCCLAT